jgi:hypothetical protein
MSCRVVAASVYVHGQAFLGSVVAGFFGMFAQGHGCRAITVRQ